MSPQIVKKVRHTLRCCLTAYRNDSLTREIVTVSTLLTVLLVWPMTTLAWGSTTFSGQATGVRVTALGISTVISDTGPLPPSGGAKNVSLLSASIPGVLTADVFHATTIAQASASNSHASLADLSLSIGSYTISATFLMSKALARCLVSAPGDPPAISGSSQISALTINGQTFAVSAAPNQTISLPGGYLVINEQQTSVVGQTGDITVNALHVVVNGVADVVISSAHADITCSNVSPTCTGDDFEVGEGEDHNPDTGDREEHSVAASNRQDYSDTGGRKQQSVASNMPGSSGYWGHLEFVRQGRNPLTVHATRITKFVMLDAYTRHIEGEAEVNGEPGHTFAADMTDNHTRGGKDRFHISTDRGDTGGNDLEHGDEEIEEPCGS